LILYCATTNPGKLREFQRALPAPFEVRRMPGFAGIAAPEETGSTFEENAAQKALYYSKRCDDFLFVDDSGLEADALGGEPGVYSARYAGPQATDQDNNRLLIERMSGKTDRTARFVCVVALARRGELIKSFRGEVQGELLREPRGANGFGYDPLFYYVPFGCSFGEIAAERKMQVSHRGKALRAMADYLSRCDFQTK
jgi:XTP/dITP diphosphohydrolase